MPDFPLLSPQKVMVIGASSGIGAELVRLLAKNNYRVAAVARREPLLSQLSAENPNILPYPHDVTDFAAIPALFSQICGDLGGLDLIIYVAGVQPPVSPDEYNFDKDQEMININLLGAMAWLNCAATRFHQTKVGHIVGISSVAGDRGRSAFPAYHTSKAALSTYLESLRNRLSKRGVTVTTIKPGFVQTPLLENATKTFWVISAEQAARGILQAITTKQQTVYLPARWRWVMLIIQHIPSFLFRRLSI